VTEFMKPSFSVAMPGERAKQWPVCGAEGFGLVCDLEFGHPGHHGTGVIAWARGEGERWIWKNGKREPA
jgi:hypothetical protein